MRFILVGVVFVFSISVYGNRKKTVLTPFQKNIQSCLQDEVDIKKMTSLVKIYRYVSDKYFLLSSELLGREVLYKMKNETRKLKFEDGNLQLFKILEEEDDRVVLLNNEVRQRSLTTEAYLAQLLIQADIRSDWMKMSEKRSDSTRVELTTFNGDIKALQIERTQLKKKLECGLTGKIESCTCHDLN